MRRIPSLILPAAILAACGSDSDSVAGRGVITETTNIAARGRVVVADSVPLASGQVRVVRADDVPEAWNGIVRSADSLGPDGAFRLEGLVAADFELYAVAKDSLGRDVSGKLAFRVPGTDSVVQLPDLAIARWSLLQGRYAAWDSLRAVLDSGWVVRATVRGLGRWVFLDTLGGWKLDSVPSGDYRVRIQKLDGVPGHETTVWEGTIAAP